MTAFLKKLGLTAVAAAFFLLVWPTPWRTVVAGDGSSVIQINRLTGEVNVTEGGSLSACETRLWRAEQASEVVETREYATEGCSY